MEELSFELQNGKHILIPKNKISLDAQNKAFEMFEQLQLNLINSYNKISDSKKYLLSNRVASFFIMCFLNGDGASFRCLVGYDGKGLMTKEELKNIKRDYKIALRKRKIKNLKLFCF